MKRRYDRNLKAAERNWEKFYHLDTLNPVEKRLFYLTDSIQRKSIVEFDLRSTLNDYIYGISLPCMDSKREFALVTFGGGRIRAHGAGHVFLFRNIAGKWVLIKKTNPWST